jgi:uroporphyrinogen-III synthase
MMRVLVLRPEPGASATVERARKRGLDAIALPLFEIEPVEWQAPDASRFDALLLTSANAVRFGGEQLEVLRGLPVHAVGEATAEAARQAGFDVSSAGDSGVERLLGSIDPSLRLLHLAGADRKGPQQPRQEIMSVTVYRSKPRNDLDLTAARDSVAMVHSPRAAGRFAELIGANRSFVTIAAISRDAADAAGSGWAAIAAADAPTDEALLALTERLCNKAQAR